MFRTLLPGKNHERTVAAVIPSKAASLMESTAHVKTVWQPQWATTGTPHAIALAINYDQKQPSSPLDNALAIYTATTSILLPSSSPAIVYEFDPAIAMSGNAWHHGREFELSLKGAPEAILTRCNLTESEREEVYKAVVSMAAEGHQVIALAHALLSSAPGTLAEVRDISFAGLIATTYTPRQEARQTIKEALHAGISVRIITGDHFETALSVGRQLGLIARRDQVIDSRHFIFMNDYARDQAVKNALLYARATQKDMPIIIAALEKTYDTVVTSSTLSDLSTLTKSQRRS